ncbi:MAG: hypothetical protein IT374_20260, partial [Polyangiaceae bacterium]|nr:hypothetical protein [Polyangiaceae bacterium]
TGGASAGTGGASAGSGGASAGSGGASAGSGGASAGSGGATAGAGGASAGAAGTGGAGGAVGCVGTDTACTTSTNTQGLCRSGVCADCAEPADDGACGAAYGAGNVCLAAACGVCDAVGTTYVVDPVNGDDALATGSGTSGGAAAARCAFKTVTAAIAAIGGNAAGPALTISVVGPSTLDAGETYPLRVPRLVTVTTSGGDVIVKPTGDDRVFDLATDGATLDGGAHLLDIDATSLVGNNTVGVLVTTGSTDATTLRRVRITGAPASCVAVGGTGRVTVKEGTHLTSCGRLSPRAAFTVGDGAAFASFVAAAGEAPIHIEQSPTGLAVIGSAAVKLSGVPDPVTVGQGTILIEKCAGSGVLITQSATSVGGPPLCELDGVVSFANGGGIGGSGLRATWTSNVKLRNSAMLGNTGHGVHLIAPNGGAGTLRVDLGTAGDPGHNTLQRTNAQGNINLGVGVCFSPANRTNLTIPARGNIFGPNDCASSTATLSRLANGPNACSGGRDTGVDATPASNSIDVATCQ